MAVASVADDQFLGHDAQHNVVQSVRESERPSQEKHVVQSVRENLSEMELLAELAVVWNGHLAL